MKSNSPFRKTDPPGSEEKPGILDKIRNIASAVVSPKTTIAKSLLGAAKSKIAENLRPYGYGTDEDSAASRVLGSILKPEPGSVSHDKTATGYVGPNAPYRAEQGEHATRERQDLLNLMLKGEQVHNSVPVSEYRPTVAENPNAVYYSSPETERDIINMVQTPGFDPSEMSNLKEGGRVLGSYQLNPGEDERGRYVSYYDKWDLNPYKKSSKVLDSITDAAQSAAGITPTELYGRVYY